MLTVIEFVAQIGTAELILANFCFRYKRPFCKNGK